MLGHTLVTALTGASLVSALRPANIAKRHASLLVNRAAAQEADVAGAAASSAYFPPPDPPLLSFASAKAKDFYVDGKTIPYVDFDVGPTYAGLLPVSKNANETQQLFFWFYPAVNSKGVNNLAFWTNGGPGCSSMEAAFQETGPISWIPGQARPSQNPFSWTDSSSILYVEQPVGTGYTQGTPTARNEVDAAAAVFGFLQNWLEVFPEMKGKNFFLTGESYAGYYVPYIADYIYSHQADLALPLQGTGFFDPSLSYTVIQEEIPTWPLVERYANVFAFNSTFMSLLKSRHQSCGYADYLAKYAAAPPPKAPFPIPKVGTYDDQNYNEKCDLFTLVYNAALQINPGFNIYHVIDTAPTPWSVLGFPYTKQNWPGQDGDPVYFNRTEVKKTLHVPEKSDWAICSDFKSKPVRVFPKGDASVASALSVLPRVIEKSKRTIIGHGLTDMVLMAEGTRIAIQNMTWNGNQGFRTPISTPLIVKDIGSLGTYHIERNFAYVEVALCGHQIPQYQPQAGLQIFEYLLGQRSTPSV